MNWLKTKSSIGIILPVMTFILVSSEHCVADAFYYIFGGCSGKQLL